MVIRGHSMQDGRARGALMTDLVIAMAILALLIFPITYAFWDESRTARSHYQRAMVMELVDGEMELLAAGGWKAFAAGVHPYVVQADSATNLPPGRFLLVLQPPLIELRWHPDEQGLSGPVTRQCQLP